MCLGIGETNIYGLFDNPRQTSRQGKSRAAELPGNRQVNTGSYGVVCWHDPHRPLARTNRLMNRVFHHGRRQAPQRPQVV